MASASKARAFFFLFILSPEGVVDQNHFREFRNQIDVFVVTFVGHIFRGRGGGGSTRSSIPLGFAVEKEMKEKKSD